MRTLPFLVRAILALAVASLLSWHGLRKRSLSKSGAMAAWAVGFLSFLASLRFGLLLIAFYQSSSSLTKLKGAYKKTLEEGHKEGGQRDHVQVLSCSLVATVVAVVFLALAGEDDRPVNFSTDPLRGGLLCAYLGHYATCCGDTWASEVGVLDPWVPLLVTAPWRPVPKGTNGGMSAVGTVASLAGGVFMGFVFWAVGPAGESLSLVWLGAWAGFGGSLLDSLLGATCQASWYCSTRKMVVSSATAADVRARGEAHGSTNASVKRVCGVDLLTNEQVNAVSVLATTVAAGVVGGWVVR